MYSPPMFRWIQYMNNNLPPKTQEKSIKSTKKKNTPRKKKAKAPKFSSTVSVKEYLPVATSNRRVTGKPDIVHLPNGDCVIEHSEFFADLNGTAAFTALQFAVNPGVSGTFPWLSQIAQNYESYVFDKLEFEYQNAVGSTAIGTVMLAVDYDASDPPPVDKIQLASYQDFVREAPWVPFIQKNRPQNLRKRSSFFVRVGALSPNQDIKLYDTGNLVVATQGMAGATPVGELYTKYRVKFMTPQLQNPAIGTSKSSRVSALGALVAPVASAASNAPLIYGGNGTTLTSTATQAYSALVSITISSGATPPVLDTSASTCTIELPNSSVTGNSLTGFLQVSFLTGQVLSIGNSAANPANIVLQFGQFNTAGL